MILKYGDMINQQGELKSWEKDERGGKTSTMVIVFSSDFKT